MVGEFLPDHLKFGVSNGPESKTRYQRPSDYLGQIGLWLAQNQLPPERAFDQIGSAIAPIVTMLDPTSLTAKILVMNELFGDQQRAA